MRILIFSNTYKPIVSGVVTSIALFRQGLVAAGHDVHVIAPESEDYEDEEPYIFRCPAFDLPEQVDLSVTLPFKTAMMSIVRGIMLRGTGLDELWTHVLALILLCLGIWFVALRSVSRRLD